MPSLSTATAAKLEEEFNRLRGNLEQALTNFRRSGMGDEVDEDVRLQQSFNVYSSKFQDFCEGQPLVLYAYELMFKQDGLLRAFSAHMPLEAAHTSEMQRTVVDLSEAKSLRSGSRSRSSSRLSREGGGESSSRDRLIDLMSTPLRFAEDVQATAARMQISALEHERLSVQIIREKASASRELFAELEMVESTIERRISAGEEGTSMLNMLQRRKEKILALLQQVDGV